MLVLSRKEGERLVIGDDITIVVSKVNGNRVSIGIEAPRDVRIVRDELRVKDEKAAATAVKSASSAVGLTDFVATLPFQRTAS